MTHLTFFQNMDSSKYFMLDPLNQTLLVISDSNRQVLHRYRHLMGFSGEDKVYQIPDYKTMKLFQKALAKLDLTQVEGDVAQHLVDMYPEYFI